MKDDNPVGSRKKKERISFMLCTNMTGTDRRIPAVITKVASPQCLKKYRLPSTASLACDYYVNAKSGWQRSDLYNEWLKKFDDDMRRQGRKIVLFVDNCSAHIVLGEYPNIEHVFLPANTTAKLQPLDQGVIAAVKRRYKAELSMKYLQYQLDAPESEQITRRSIISQCDIKVATDILARVWKNVKPKMICNCFRHAGWVKQVEGIPPALEPIVDDCPDPPPRSVGQS